MKTIEELEKENKSLKQMLEGAQHLLQVKQKRIAGLVTEKLILLKEIREATRGEE